MADMTKSTAELGMEMREGKIAKVGSTKRIQELNGLMHANRPTMDIHRSRVFTKVFQETEGEPMLRRRYKAMAEVYRTLKPVIYDYERLAGWPAFRIRAAQVVLEIHADWLTEELDTIGTRDFDPTIVPDEFKEEFREVHLPYWKDKTVTALFKKLVTPEQYDHAVATGVADFSNYLGNNGSHFLLDLFYLLENGFVKYYDIAQEELNKLNPNDPDSLGKVDFYKGIIDVCLGIKQLGKNYAEAIAERAAQEKDPVRKQELLEMETVMQQVPWLPPRNFYEAIEMVWLASMFLYMEGAGPSNSYGRFDQYMYPFYKKGIEDGTLTPELAMEFIEELYIKWTSNPWLASSGIAYYFGGFYRYQHIDVGGLTATRQDASNDLSYLCLRAMRHVKTMGPAVGILVHQKTPDSLLNEAAQLSAEGMGHPSFYNVETMLGMLSHRGGGVNGHSPYSDEDMLAYGTAIGCVEPGVMGLQYGHSDSAIINLAELSTLAITSGVKGTIDTVGLGQGEVVTFQSDDATKFESFEDYCAAFKAQVQYAIKESHAGMIIAEKLIAEQFHLPTFTSLCRDAVKKGIDVVEGGAYVNIGPTIQSLGFGTCVDSLAAIKKVIFDDKKASMAELEAAITANFKGYEELQANLKRAPKYGNDDDYVDDIAADLWQFFAKTVKELKMYRGAYCDPAVQMVQANVGFGSMTDATANGRLAGKPTSDTMSASQQADTHGPTTAARSYGKLDFPLYSNGTLLNMWVSRSELVESSVKN